MGAAPSLQGVLGVMAGGALGALARYLVAAAVQGQLSATPYAGLPLATLLVNVTGSFALAFLGTRAVQGQLGGFWLLTLGTGFVGAFTTFSTFELEAHSLLKGGAVAYALLYVGGNLFVGYGALLLGQVAATRFQ
jgi:CrcB protein